MQLVHSFEVTVIRSCDAGLLFECSIVGLRRVIVCVIHIVCLLFFRVGFFWVCVRCVCMSMSLVFRPHLAFALTGYFPYSFKQSRGASLLVSYSSMLPTFD